MYREQTYESWPFPNEIEWSYPKAFVYAEREFLSSITEDREPRVTGADGRRLIQIVEACYESAKMGRTIKVS